MKVKCDVSHADLDNDYGGTTEGVVVTCGRCNHSEESFGTSDNSVRRCLALLRENCPQGESNFYVPDED